MSLFQTVKFAYTKFMQQEESRDEFIKRMYKFYNARDKKRTKDSYKNLKEKAN